VIGKFIVKYVAGPLIGNIAAKAGEAIGDLVAYHINPPEEGACEHPSWAVGDRNGETVNACLTCGYIWSHEDERAV
jgi:hypothetical protein